jgi:hypothetical protein
MMDLTAGWEPEADPELSDRLPWERDPHRLWSLWEMLEVFAIHYIEIGRLVGRAELTFDAIDIEEDEQHWELTDEETANIKDVLQKLLKECRSLGMRTSTLLLSKSINDLPETKREFDLLINAVKSEIQSKRFLFVPDHRFRYYNIDLSERLTVAFPSASRELVAASRSYALGLWTACVFHAMRGAEIGVRSLASELGGIVFSTDITTRRMGADLG